MPGGGDEDEDEDAEGVAELLEVPEPQEPRSPQQVGCTHTCKLSPPAEKPWVWGSPPCPRPSLSLQSSCCSSGGRSLWWLWSRPLPFFERPLVPHPGCVAIGP